MLQGLLASVPLIPFPLMLLGWGQCLLEGIIQLFL